MDFTAAIKILIRDLEETRDIIEEIAETSERHSAELKLVKTRINSAVETISLLPHLIHQQQEKIQSPSADIKGKSKNQEEHTIEKREPSLNDMSPEEIQVSDISNNISSSLSSDNEASGDDILSLSEEPSEIPAEVPEGDTENHSRSILADRFSSDSILGEKIGTQKTDSDVAARIGNKPITDITSAIGINDRFFYIRELFGNNSEEYSKTLSRLNKAASLAEALTILDNSAVSKPGTEAYTSFTELLKRKFPST